VYGPNAENVGVVYSAGTTNTNTFAENAMAVHFAPTTACAAVAAFVPTEGKVCAHTERNEDIVPSAMNDAYAQLAKSK
jgi:hypothetical protein